VADGTIFEKHGVVACSIITEPFKLAANSMAKRQGFPEYRYAVMPHPIGNLRPEQVRQRAQEVLPQVLQILGLPAE
jgi:hypothetical protein